ncbi:DUF6650 family protein [Bacteroides graminisolvens]|uniref:DUF6650 family protein n=1 Tax=Bacteroides graminisolvens TaxID=477666 RepID=UPI0029C5FDCF|nr:DUF6650 family protein [Bacteroides graminisolvens]
MNFTDIRERLTGISCPIFGISWNPTETERTKANKIIRFLEDRRVLYNPYEQECLDHCVHSIIEIRHYLTDKMQDIPSDTQLYGYVSAMRKASRKFVNQFPNKDKEVRFYINNHDCISSWKFNSALGELRGVFGIMIAQMAVAYGIDIEEELASIFPSREE